MTPLAIALFLSLPVPVAQDWDVQLAPFDAIRWPGADDRPEVHVEGRWYGWLALDELTVEEIVGACKERWPSRWQKRVGEDLVEALVLMGHPPGETVRMVLTELERDLEVVLEAVPMTKANRQAVLAFNRSGALTETVRVRRVEREHAGEVAPEFAELARVLESDEWAASRTLSRAQAEQDLDQLEWAIEHTHSYRDLRGVDYRAAFDAVRAGLPDRIALEAFALQLSKLIALLGDGHAGVRGSDGLLPGRCLPFLLEEVAGGVAAVLPERDVLVDPEHPFVVALDGRSLDDWLGLVASIQPASSEANARFRALRDLRRFGWARLEAGAPESESLEVVLTDERGRSRRELELDLATRKPTYGSWPRRESQGLDDDIGYLRVESMSSDPGDLRAIVAAMDSFRDTQGLVIDVRGNGGGSRDILRLLIPYFRSSDAPPRVVNVAAYRLTPDDRRGAKEGYLENRGLYPLESSRWSAAEREVIEACAAGFEPDWTPPEDDFSAWHYCVIGPTDALESTYPYTRPVVVLMDTGCFSATDIFLGAFSELPGVTLMGTPSGGGSGRSRYVRLANSGLEARLSTMASFRPDGRRYEGLGVEPDVRVVPAATDFLVGGTDSVLEAALERIRSAD